MLVRKAPSHCSRWREKILAVLGLGRTKVRPLQRRGATAPPARCEEGNGAEQDSPRGAEQDEAVAAPDGGGEDAGGGKGGAGTRGASPEGPAPVCTRSF